MFRTACSRLCSGSLRLATRTATAKRTVAFQNVTKSQAWAVQQRHWSSKKEDSPEVFDAKWEAYFDNPNLDSFALKKGLNEIYGHDLVPEPKIVVAMLKAARRLHDSAMAIRILEAVKEKAAGNMVTYNYIVNAVKPTLDELGVCTPEELGLV